MSQFVDIPLNSGKEINIYYPNNIILEKVWANVPTNKLSITKKNVEERNFFCFNR